MPIVKCDYCGKEIYRKPYNLQKHKKHYCCIEHKGFDMRQLNKIIIKENYAEMIINDYIVLIDIEDIEKINQYKWHLKYDKTVNDCYIYAWERKYNRRQIRLHSYLTNCPKNMEVDHINRNPKDNRKCNLRIVEQSENALNKGFYSNNKSGYKYIHWSKYNKSWIVEVKRFNKTVRIGSRKDLLKAIEIRNQYCKENGIEIINNPKWVDVVETIRGVE